MKQAPNGQRRRVIAPFEEKSRDDFSPGHRVVGRDLGPGAGDLDQLGLRASIELAQLGRRRATLVADADVVVHVGSQVLDAIELQGERADAGRPAGMETELLRGEELGSLARPQVLEHVHARGPAQHEVTIAVQRGFLDLGPAAQGQPDELAAQGFGGIGETDHLAARLQDQSPADDAFFGVGRTGRPGRSGGRKEGERQRPPQGARASQESTPIIRAF
jgi:hypothetical protein